MRACPRCGGAIQRFYCPVCKWPRTADWREREDAVEDRSQIGVTLVTINFMGWIRKKFEARCRHCSHPRFSHRDSYCWAERCECPGYEAAGRELTALTTS